MKNQTSMAMISESGRFSSACDLLREVVEDHQQLPPVFQQQPLENPLIIDEGFTPIIETRVEYVPERACNVCHRELTILAPESASESGNRYCLRPRRWDLP